MLSPYSYICIFCILKRPWIFLYLALSCVLLHPKVSVCNSCVHIVVCMYIIVPLHPVSFSVVLYELFTAFPLTYSSLTLVFCISCICFFFLLLHVFVFHNFYSCLLIVSYCTSQSLCFSFFSYQCMFVYFL